MTISHLSGVPTCEAFVQAAFSNDRLGARTDSSQQDIENEIRVAMPMVRSNSCTIALMLGSGKCTMELRTLCRTMHVIGGRMTVVECGAVA